MHGNVLPDSVPASVVIRRGFRKMQEGDVPRVPLPPSLLSLSFPPPSGNLLMCVEMQKKETALLMLNKSAAGYGKETALECLCCKCGLQNKLRGV